MKKASFLFLTTIVVLMSQTIIAQNMYPYQIIVCSGGDFSNPDDYVTVATYLPNSEQTIIFDTIYTQSVQDVFVVNETAFVAAQDSIVKYDLNTYQRLASVEAIGIHKLAVKDETLIATFKYPASSGFVKTYLSSDLSLVHSFSEVSGESDGIFIFPGSLRTVVAVPGVPESTIGKLAWFDMADNTFYAEGDMNGYGNGVSYFASYDIGFPNYVAITKTPDGYSTFNTYGFDAVGNTMYIYSFDAIMQGFTGQNNTILYAHINDGIGQLDLENHILKEQLIISSTTLPIASSVYDSVNSLFYVATTDFHSTGVGEIYNISGVNTGYFDAGISPDAIAIDYRESTGIIDLHSIDRIKVFPVPSSNVITVEVCNEIYLYDFKVLDITGRHIIAGKLRFNNNIAHINISSLQNGTYFLELSYEQNIITSIFIKD